MFKLCSYCGLEIYRWNFQRQFCSVQCRFLYKRYENQVNKLRSNLENKIYVKPDTIRVRKYRDWFEIDKVLDYTTVN